MSLQAAVIPVTPLMQNCTLMWCTDTLEGVVIDPGGDVDVIIDAIGQTGMKPQLILLTHGHFDHVGGAMALSEELNLPIHGPHQDDAFITEAVVDTAEGFGLSGDWRDVTGNVWLDDGDEVLFGNERLAVIHTPGHTPGHVIFFNEGAKIAQVGDVLFQGSVGRTDFPRGNIDTLMHSITQKLWPLGNDVTFIPGHGPQSTFGQERATNLIVGDAVLKD